MALGGPEPIRAVQGSEAQDERELIERIRQSDARAFETIFKRYADSCYRTAYRYVREAAAARDIAQDVLLKLWEQRATLDIDRSVRHYLHVAARHHAFNYLRRCRIETLASQQMQRSGVVAPGMRAVVMPREDERLAASELRNRVADAVDQLPERQRMAVLLKWRSQLTHPEIAELMGISVKGVEIHLTRAFRVLRERLRGCVGYLGE